MMRHFRIITLVILCLSISGVYAQERFPADSVKFIKKLKPFMSNVKDKNKAKTFLKEFEDLWESGVIDERFRKDVYRISNAMLEKRARPYPHFELYLRTIMNLAQEGRYDENYQVWTAYYSSFLKRRKTTVNKLAKFLQASFNLFSDNSLLKTSVVNWRILDNRFNLEHRNNNLLVNVEKGDLICYAKRDSNVIFETEGYYNFTDFIFHGKGGLVTWERSGVGRDTIFAKLKNYNINLKKSDFQVDTVLFTNKFYFEEPLYGSLYDKVVNTKSSREISYPRFVSFTKRFEMKNIFKEVDYSGGFSMKGAKFYGSGSKEEPATLSFFRKDTVVLKVKTLNFVFKKDQILSLNASPTFYLDKDSIHHPGLKFNYNFKKREVILTRNKENTGRAPYVDTYHGLDMLVGKIVWNMNKPKLELKPGPIQKIGYFESAEFYSQDRYVDLQKMDDVNPLVAVRRFIRNNANYNEVYAEDFASFMRMSIPATHKYLLRLAFDGFIDYDIDNDKFVAKEKLYHYLKASVGKKDYDILALVSESDNKNGEISLLNYNFKMDGVYQIFLSDSQDVVVFPKNGQINVQKNRDFSFDGRVNAGLFHFYGSNFFFSYKNFKIDLNNVERLQMHVKSKTELDKYGKPILIPVQSPIYDIQGDLLIDKPFNKSGIKKAPEYPIFNSKKKSYVYYDSPNIQNGAYHRDDFYFQVYPYTFDSLDNLTRKSLVFDGYFNSAGILPGFEEKIRLRPDYSLGFVKNTPPEGTPVYQGKGNLKGVIDLSNQGLLSSGELKYINSITKSDEITLLPELFKATNAKFDNPKTSGSPEYPLVEGKGVDVNWYVNRDSLVTESVEKPIKMYNDKTSLKGQLILQPNGMFGKGLIDLTKAEITSKLYKFKENVFDSDTADFRLKEEDGIGGFDFKTNNVNAHVDYIEKKGVFKSNGEGSFTEFPKNKYICFMDEFSWYMDGETIEMSASEKAQAHIKSNEDLGPILEEDVELSGSQFISVHPKQDSLNFIAPSATYNIRTKLISAKGVQYMRVADAIIYPKEGVVEVEKEAVMRTLKESKIVANSATKYHTIYNASTKIHGRRLYQSSGDYDYYSADSVKQVIHFDEIGVDSTMQTYGKGKVAITDDFTFSPQFAYNGKVNLYSNKEYLMFKGYTKIAHNCERTKPQWFMFESEIDPNEILIPIKSPLKGINGGFLHASLMITNDSTHIYPAFLTKHEKYSDTEIIPAEGFLKFDKSEGKYMIASKDKLDEPSLPGNFISMHHNVCNVYSEGLVNLGTDFGRFKVNSAGNANQNANGESTVLNLVSFLEFFFNDKCLNIMAKDLETAMDGFDPQDFYYNAITELVGEKDAEAYIAQLSLGNIKKYPKKLEKGMVLSELKLRWNQKKRAYESEGQIGVGNILKKQINRLIDGHVQIKKKRSGDEFYLYLEPFEGVWYYFHMSRNVLKVVSSNEEFNTILREMKPGDRKLKAEKKEKPYSFYPGTEGMRKKFLKQFENEEYEEEEDTEENTEEENY